jgi:hypothetical protein
VVKSVPSSGERPASSEEEVSSMRRIRIKVKRPRPAPVELDLRTPSGRPLPY